MQKIRLSKNDESKTESNKELGHKKYLDRSRIEGKCRVAAAVCKAPRIGAPIPC